MRRGYRHGDAPASPAQALIVLGRRAGHGYSAAAMTRKSIEAWAKGFIVALSAVFLFALWKVLGMIGIL